MTFDDIVSRNTTFATAIKAAWSTAKVFGPVVAQDGIIYAHDYSDPNLPTTFSDYYLSKMAAASVTAGKPLLDAFDVHYYTSNGSTSQCLQVPRMFWDPNFKDFTASATDSIDFGWSGQNNYFDNSLYPRQMIPRLQGKISSAYSGKSTAAPGLSFSEYNAGCETSIEGGVAEADLLGIFGREGMFSATAWPLQGITNNGKLTNYLVAAYDLYRNYDGSGSTVGDTSAYAQTSDVEDTSVYAFAHSGNAADVELVAINKKSSALTVTVHVASAPSPHERDALQPGQQQGGRGGGVDAPVGELQRRELHGYRDAARDQRHDHRPALDVRRARRSPAPRVRPRGNRPCLTGVFPGEARRGRRPKGRGSRWTCAGASPRCAWSCGRHAAARRPPAPKSLHRSPRRSSGKRSWISNVDSLDVIHGALRIVATMADGSADVSVVLGGTCEHREVGGGVSTATTLVWALEERDVAEAIDCSLTVHARAREGGQPVDKVADLAVAVELTSPEPDAAGDAPPTPALAGIDVAESVLHARTLRIDGHSFEASLSVAGTQVEGDTEPQQAQAEEPTVEDQGSEEDEQAVVEVE